MIGWIKGLLNARSNACANVVNVYTRYTLVSSCPLRVRDGLFEALDEARLDLGCTCTSMLRDASMLVQRIGSERGKRNVKVSLS